MIWKSIHLFFTAWVRPSRPFPAATARLSNLERQRGAWPRVSGVCGDGQQGLVTSHLCQSLHFSQTKPAMVILIYYYFDYFENLILELLKHFRLQMKATYHCQAVFSPLNNYPRAWFSECANWLQPFDRAMYTKCLQKQLVPAHRCLCSLITCCDFLAYFTLKTKQRTSKVCRNYKTLPFCLVCLAWSARRFSRQPAQSHHSGPQREERGGIENPGALSAERLHVDGPPLLAPSGDC